MGVRVRKAGLLQVLGWIAVIAGCKGGDAPSPSATTTPPAPPESARATTTATGAPPRVTSQPRSRDPELSAFLSWVGAHRSDPRKAAPKATCYGPGDPDEGWCLGVCDGFKGGGAMMCTVKYWKANPRAARFDAAMVPAAVDCSDLGETTDRAQKGPDIGCKLTSPPHAGLHAVINRRAGWASAVFLVTSEYLERDRKMVVP